MNTWTPFLQKISSRSLLLSTIFTTEDLIQVFTTVYCLYYRRSHPGLPAPPPYYTAKETYDTAKETYDTAKETYDTAKETY